ncbi:uncharacterized protein BO95DRAFT_445427 [Aspergillus brunneoviolaceus CBS 621.78]|uniref:Uncharacterized protein n=1 Tax=Aspergillus brunneoviolaceus CBS 621.78 TaxID=1450534 RepID=A0ACD1G1H7_9EURO|nr:hypothetical protein BO95DRAFT_445427 [Aspergillus brunneoviolaceus CBS 621.78]RAH43123.1 hypothetical protein BO95DRAFT_445427 [Aspergillus brunneoviolaceus CBS 621.78]
MLNHHQIKRKPLPQADDDGTIRGVIRISPCPTPTPSEKPPLLDTPPPPYTPMRSPSPRLPRPPPSQTIPTRAATTIHDLAPATSPAPSLPRTTPDLSVAQKAYGEARHFLGGLLSHPTESTKHVTILRHSSGVVFYRGSTTSVTISIFSDSPLPADRTLYLQSKGWTGKTGMRTKALLRLTDDWVDVTPSHAVQATQVEPADERAWQRDIAKFRKKAPPKVRETHRLRETIVVRVPAEAGDGYFQLVLCGNGKKKGLCYSPVFRVLSTSLSPSSCRGASLSTMPLEVGAMVLGMYAQTAAEAVIAPVTAAVQDRIQPYKPSWKTQTAAETAYSMSGAGDRVSSLVSVASGPTTTGNPSVAREYQPISLDLGPQPPFPVDFTASRVAPAACGDGTKYQLSKVPDAIQDQYHGVFFGWVRVCQSVAQAPQPGETTYLSPRDSQWQGVVLSILSYNPALEARVNLSRARGKETIIRLIDDSPPLVPQSRLQVRIMGYLRPDLPPAIGNTERELQAARDAAAEAAIIADACDLAYAQEVLGHPAWSAEGHGLRDGSEESGQAGTWVQRTRDGVTNIRSRGQRMVENVPLHWVGVRGPNAGAVEKQMAMNGFYIVRG